MTAGQLKDANTIGTGMKRGGGNGGMFENGKDEIYVTGETLMK